MIKPKSPKEIELLAEGGRRLGEILEKLGEACQPGLEIRDLDDLMADLVPEEDTSAFYNYTPKGAPRPYPARVCVSVNDEIVHGIPTEGDYVLKSGDVVTVDAGLTHQGMVVDSARTVVVGEGSKDAYELVNACENALTAGIKKAVVGAHVGDISAAIEAAVPKKFSIFRELVGHGVGYSVHESPSVPNYGTAGTGPELPAGTVIAIEPMISAGDRFISLDDDGYTYRTADGSLSAHFEHTVAITEEGPQVLTKS